MESNKKLCQRQEEAQKAKQTNGSYPLSECVGLEQKSPSERETESAYDVWTS